MTTNYYHTVNVVRSGETPATLTEKLDQWGTKLVTKGAGRGRTYSIDPKTKEIVEQRAAEPVTTSLKGKFKAAVGIALKKVAATFDGTIKAKYRLVSAGDSTKESLFARLQPAKKVSVVQQGNDLDCCIACLDCFGALCNGLSR